MLLPSIILIFVINGQLEKALDISQNDVIVVSSALAVYPNRLLSLCC